uniref:Uncharacterized protein n=1 Tax=Lactuca sativa TaxID=4236 RepID=A0A9R1WVT2_LACSA|nr:hypothetical protein LSAT_V11C800404410 [Lactuca sativa]
MDDFHNPRVQTVNSKSNDNSASQEHGHLNFVKSISKSSSAVLNFSENCTSKLLQPYLDGIVGKLIVLLQGALTALASVADSSQVLFIFIFSHQLVYFL